MVVWRALSTASFDEFFCRVAAALFSLFAAATPFLFLTGIDNLRRIDGGSLMVVLVTVGRGTSLSADV